MLSVLRKCPLTCHDWYVFTPEPLSRAGGPATARAERVGPERSLHPRCGPPDMAQAAVSDLSGMLLPRHDRSNAMLKARVLADAAAERGVLRFVDRMQQDAEHDDFMAHGPAMIALSATMFPLRHLVAAYAAHPDFQREWEPNERRSSRTRGSTARASDRSYTPAGLRYRVAAKPLPGMRRTADLLLRPPGSRSSSTAASGTVAPSTSLRRRPTRATGEIKSTATSSAIVRLTHAWRNPTGSCFWEHQSAEKKAAVVYETVVSRRKRSRPPTAWWTAYRGALRLKCLRADPAWCASRRRTPRRRARASLKSPAPCVVGRFPRRSREQRLDHSRSTPLDRRLPNPPVNDDHEW